MDPPRRQGIQHEFLRRGAPGRPRRGGHGRQGEYGHHVAFLARPAVLRLSVVRPAAPEARAARQGGAVPGAAGAAGSREPARGRDLAIQRRAGGIPAGTDRRRDPARGAADRQPARQAGGRGLGADLDAGRLSTSGHRQLRESHSHAPGRHPMSTDCAPDSPRRCVSSASFAACCRGASSWRPRTCGRVWRTSCR